MKKSFVYVNGSIVPRERAMVSAFDRGLLYGDGVFETMRAYGGEVFRLGDHLRRLRKSARELRLALPLPAGELAGAIRALIERNKLPDAYIRITLTRGPHSGSLALQTDLPATLIIDCRPVTPYPDAWYRRGIRLAISQSRRGTSQIAPRHKVLSYVENLLALDAARGRGADEALILTEQGHLCEGATSNIFIVCGKRILTPSDATNLLSGVTRGTVLRLCRRAGIEVAEGLFTPEDAFAADEVFITNSIMEIMPVAAIDNHAIRLCPGPTTLRLLERYRKEARPRAVKRL